MSEKIETFFEIFLRLWNVGILQHPFIMIFAVLGKQLTRYRSFIILSCFGNDRAARAVRFLTNIPPFYGVLLTGNKIKIIINQKQCVLIWYENYTLEELWKVKDEWSPYKLCYIDESHLCHKATVIRVILHQLESLIT